MRLVLIAAALLAASGSLAAATQSLDEIRTAALELVASEQRGVGVNIEVGQLDPRLRLHACDQPLEAFYPPGSRQQGNTTVGVRCPGSTPWSLYVPVRVQVLRPVLVAARNLPAGTRLTPADLRSEPRDVSRIRADFYEEPAQLLDKELARTVSAGQIVSSRMVRTPKLVERGQRVSLLAGRDGFQVQMLGTAMDAGGVGERIRVKSLESRRVVEGVIRADGSVDVVF
jgi:flagella basal body P-ring formation protein FlgA